MSYGRVGVAANSVGLTAPINTAAIVAVDREVDVASATDPHPCQGGVLCHNSACAATVLTAG